MIGVVIVTYCASDVIRGCLDSLIASEGEPLRVILVDNASPDDTVATITNWASETGADFTDLSTDPGPLAHFSLLRSELNRGFAGGVNLGLERLLQEPDCTMLWLLNPDCEVDPTAANAFREKARSVGPFALMGSRILYSEKPGLIQSDGGLVGRWSGICRNINQGKDPAGTTRPTPKELDFISGASVVASRDFVTDVGRMTEDYFLYYEEVDWAARRGTLPLVLCEDAVIRHHGGTAIGTGSVTRLASPFALYFNNRNRMRYMARFHPAGLPFAYLASLARIAKLAGMRAWAEAWSALLALHQLGPPRAVREVLSPEAAALAFGPQGRRDG
ncbi:MAG: glycosyltransferase family 2 protein [Pseudomonadota bacterium]